MSKWNPADHLPECGVTAYPICICDRLRACEQRVNDEWVRDYGPGKVYAVALDAAREAIVRVYDKDSPTVQSQTEWGIEIALAAIDALREEKP